MKARRFAFLFATLPLALYAYACSSDSKSTDSPNEDAGQTQNEDASTKPNPEKDADSTETDSGNEPGTDSGTDAGQPIDGGDAGSDAATTDLSCQGNPLLLSADAGTPDGGVKMDGGALRQLTVTTPGDPNPPFFTGPQWIDADGGTLVVSQLFGEPGALLVGVDGGAATSLRKAPASSYALGNTADNTHVYTAISSNKGAGTSAIYRTLPDGGAGPTITLDQSKKYNPTDLALGPGGNVYFTDPQYQYNTAGTTGLYRIAPNGTVTAIEIFDENNTRRYNYLALSADSKTLYVSNTEASEVRKFAVAADGTVATPSTVAVNTVEWPVGLAVDKGGNLWVTETAVNNAVGGRVEVFGSDGGKRGEFLLPNEHPTSVAFGGADSKTVYVTTQEHIFVYPARCAGIR